MSCGILGSEKSVASKVEKLNLSDLDDFIPPTNTGNSIDRILKYLDEADLRYASLERRVRELETLTEKSSSQPICQNIKDKIASLSEAIPMMHQDVSTAPEDVSTLKEDVSTAPEDVSTLKEDTSTVPEDVSAVPENTDTGVAQEIHSIPYQTDPLYTCENDQCTLITDSLTYLHIDGSVTYDADLSETDEAVFHLGNESRQTLSKIADVKKMELTRAILNTQETPDIQIEQLFQGKLHVPSSYLNSDRLNFSLKLDLK